MAKLHELDYQMLSYPPYSSDLASSAYFMLSNLNKYLEKPYYLGGIKKTEEMLDEVHGSQRGYVEQQNVFFEKPVYHSNCHGFIDLPSYIQSQRLLLNL